MKQIFLLISFVSLVAGCTQSEPEFFHSRFVISRIFDITDTSATIEGKYSSNRKRDDIVKLGYILSTNIDFDAENNIQVFSSQKDGIITCSVNGLQPDTLYYVAVYCVYRDKITGGEVYSRSSQYAKDNSFTSFQTLSE
ncbi:hypothetical protein FACS189429_1250 [Bacteroidia bacterium]|nr:hypothetical protein FACS189429_1250 [Bacteroidia bacterium]